MSRRKAHAGRRGERRCRRCYPRVAWMGERPAWTVDAGTRRCRPVRYSCQHGSYGLNSARTLTWRRIAVSDAAPTTSVYAASHPSLPRRTPSSCRRPSTPGSRPRNARSRRSGSRVGGPPLREKASLSPRFVRVGDGGQNLRRHRSRYRKCDASNCAAPCRNPTPSSPALPETRAFHLCNCPRRATSACSGC